MLVRDRFQNVFNVDYFGLDQFDDDKVVSPTFSFFLYRFTLEPFRSLSFRPTSMGLFAAFLKLFLFHVYYPKVLTGHF